MAVNARLHHRKALDAPKAPAVEIHYQMPYETQLVAVCTGYYDQRLLVCATQRNVTCKKCRTWVRSYNKGQR